MMEEASQEDEYRRRPWTSELATAKLPHTERGSLVIMPLGLIFLRLDYADISPPALSDL